MGNLCGKPKPRPPTPPATVVVKEATFLSPKDGDDESMQSTPGHDTPTTTPQSNCVALFDADALNDVVRNTCGIIHLELYGVDLFRMSENRRRHPLRHHSP